MVHKVDKAYERWEAGLLGNITEVRHRVTELQISACCSTPCKYGEIYPFFHETSDSNWEEDDVNAVFLTSLDKHGLEIDPVVFLMESLALGCKECLGLEYKDMNEECP